MAINNPELKIKLTKQKSKTSLIYKNILEAMYELFDKILEDPVENIFYEFLSITLGYIQLIIYIIDETFWPIWNQNTLIKEIRGITKYFHITPFLKKKDTIYFLMIALVAFFIFLIIILAVIITFFLRNNIKANSIFIQILKYLLPFFSNFLFGQCFLLLIVSFDCQNGHAYVDENLECRNGTWFYIEAPFCGIAIFFHILIAYFTNSLYCKSVYENSTSDVLKKSNTVPDISFLLTKVIIIITFILDKGEESEHWALLSFFIFVTGINAYITVVYRNRENKFLNLLNVIFALILNFGFDSLFIGKIFKKWGFNGAVYFFFIGVIIIILFVMIHSKNDLDFMKINYKSIERSDECLIYIKKILDMINNKNNFRNNNLLLNSFITNVEDNCLEIDCPLKKYIKNLEEGTEYNFFLYQFCDKIFTYAISKFPENISLKMFYVLFLGNKLNNKIKSQIIYNELKEYDYNLSDGFKYFKLTKYYNIKNKLNFNNFNSIEYKNDIIKFKELIEKTTFLYHRFWSSLLMNKIKGKHDFIRFNKIATKILNLIEKIDHDYSLLMKIKNNNIDLIKLYIEFINTIVSDKNKYEKQKEYLTNLIYNDNRNDSTEVDFNNFFINILDEKDLYQYLVISAENKNLGTILNVSINSCPIFGYKKEELIDKNINVLIPEILRSTHDDLIQFKTNNLKLNYYETITKKNNYTPEFFVKTVYAVSKSKYLIPLKLKVYLVSTEEGRLVFIIEIIKENFYFMLNNNNDKNNKIPKNNFYKTCYVLTDENFMIQYFSPNCCNLLQLNHNDINSNHSVMNFIQQLYDEYISCINKDTTNKDRSDFQNSEISFQNKFRKQDKIKKSSIDDNDINFMEFHPSEIGKQKQEELINKKYLLERKITWKKKIDVNFNHYVLKQSRRQSSINYHDHENIKYMDSLIDNNNNSINDFFYEQDLYMKIRKIKIQNKKIGFLFLFKKDEDDKMIPSNYKTGSVASINHPIDKFTKIKPNSTFNKQKTEEIVNKTLNDFDIKNEHQQHFHPLNQPIKIHKSITGVKEDSDNFLNLNADYIPDDEFTFEFNVNTFAYQPSKQYKENELNNILCGQATDKINKYKNENDVKNKDNLDVTESDISESDSESCEYSSSSNSDDSNNNSQKNKKTLKQLTTIENNALKKKIIIPVTINNNLNNTNNYYKVNFDNIRLMLYDFNREMLIDITEKTEKKSQVELAMLNFKSEIESGKDENYPMFNRQNMITKTDNKNEIKTETKKNDIENPIDTKLNGPKSFETNLSEAINKNERNKSFILFRNIFLFFLVVVIVCGFMTEYLSVISFNTLSNTLELINNIINVRYSNVIGIYYLRESTLLNINSSLCEANYDTIPAKNKNEYKTFVKSEILELFKDSQTRMRKIVSSSLPFSANTTLYLTQIPVNISILLPHFVIEKIEFNYLSALVMMHSVYFNLASSSTNVQQNQTDLYTYIHNSFNSIGTELKTLIVLFRDQLDDYLRKYKILFIIDVVVIFVIFIIFYFIIIYFYLLSVKIKLKYISLFFGVDIWFVKDSANKCEKYLLKLKYDNNKNKNGIADNFENDETEFKIKTSNNSFLNKNKNFNKNNSFQDLNRDKKKNMKDLNDNIFIALFGIIVLIFYFYFIYILILFCKLLQKTENLSIFIYHFQHYQLSIIELFNTFRELLYDDKTTVFNMYPLDYLNFIEDEIYDTRNDDTLYIQKYKDLLKPVDLSFVAKDLCSYNQTNYFNSNEECVQTMGVSYNYEYSVFVSHFIEQIRIRKYIIMYRLKNNYTVGNLTEYDVENWTEEKLGLNCTVRGYKSFRTHLFNSASTHSNLNVKFLTVFLPYLNNNRKVLLKGVSIKGDNKIFDSSFIAFVFVVIIISIIYLVPLMRNLHNAIYKTKKMLKLIPIHILAVQSNIETLLNISNEK